MEKKMTTFSMPASGARKIEVAAIGNQFYKIAEDGTAVLMTPEEAEAASKMPKSDAR